MTETDHINPDLLRPIGVVRSSLKRREECPHQGWEGAPEAWLEIDPAFADGLDGIAPGSEVILLTWFHEAQRNVLKVHPRGNLERPLRGVFSTRSPDRPNPIGLHRVEVLAIEEGTRLRVCPLEALDGTPIVDIKPVLPKSADM
jgi:tRNA-Thr(GGU) m(6)t(6)A37 methyltransferase TsaA